MLASRINALRESRTDSLMKLAITYYIDSSYLETISDLTNQVHIHKIIYIMKCANKITKPTNH